MGWGQRWPQRVPRPKAGRLTEGEKDSILATLEKGIAASPVLTAFGVHVRVNRGRFYIERQRQDDDLSPYTEEWGRITPLADGKKDLLLEVARRNEKWFEVDRGSAAKLIKVAEATKDRTRVLVRFTAESMSGESFGGTCLYLQHEGEWEAYTIKPSDSHTIVQAEAWLVKRKWKAW